MTEEIRVFSTEPFAARSNSADLLARPRLKQS